MKLIVAPVAQAPALASQLVNQTLQEMGDRTKQLELLDLLETIMVYKLPTLSREEIQRMIGLPDVDLKQTRFYQDVFTEGRQEEAAALALRLLHRKLGNLTADLESRLQTLTLLQIEALVDALFEFTTIGDLEAWLTQQPATLLEEESSQ